jgi:diadenylate cyclase
LRRSEALLEALRMVAPGTPLRDGIDRILQANKGALIVVGDGPEVLSVCSGGFLLDAEFTPQRLSELAKMDGALILAADVARVARGNVHLVPDPNIPTAETGTRHRTAERVARQIDVPVISVSEAMSVVTIYRDDQKYTLEPIPRVLAKANQALQTLERF